ncbi:MAG TPA: hopanoid biosynthesis-associated protein HpnK [Stellaceae bacterium]|nr:hopanoid biosynthesis-associated protein HpnK [Stellaceae bacterium]
MPKHLIVTADDFGLALPVNEAVERGHREGILTSASLMVMGRAAADAVERARRLPRLGVGLHLLLLDGKPVLPPERIPDLVGADGRFLTDPVRAGMRIFFSARTRAQAAAECRAQLEAFRATGLALDHVDGHHHFHQHPTVQRILLELAPEFGISAIRVPREPFRASWQASRDRLFHRLLAWLLHARRTAAMRRRLLHAGIRCNDAMLGLADTGRMRPERVRRFIAALPDGVSELYFHPATRRWGGDDAWPTNYEPEAEFAALIDPGVKAALDRSGAVLATFAELAKGGLSARPAS